MGESLRLAAALILGFAAVRGFRFEVTNDYIALVNTLSFNWLLLYLFFVWTIDRSLKEKDRRLKVCSAAFAVLVSLFYVVGVSISKMYRISWIWESTGYLVNTLNLFFSHTVLYYAFTFLGFRLLQKLSVPAAAPAGNRFSFRRLFLFWLSFLILYIPWYLHCYPGLLSPDSGGQIRDAIGTETLNNHHSAFLDLILRCILLPVRQMTGSLQTGIGVCTFLQMLIVTFVFAFCCEWIRKYLRSRLLRVLVWMWFGLYPVHPLFSVTLWKDILFSVTFVILVICIDSAVRNEEAFFRSRKKCAILFGCMLLLPLMRHNGWSVTMIMAVYFLFRFRGFRRQILAGCACIGLLFGLWKLVLFPALHGIDILPRHAYSVFEQQIVRTLEERRDDLSDEERAELEGYFDIPEIWTVYNPRLSDPVKNHFRDAYFNEDPGRFFRLWLRIGKRFPVVYAEAFLLNNYGYWFPEVYPWISEFWMPESVQIEDIHPAPILSIGAVRRMADVVVRYQYIKTPVFFLLFSLGGCFWVWLFCGFYCLWNNRKKFAVVLPGIALWLGIMATPISNDYRYVYGLFAALPLILALALSSGGRNESPDPGDSDIDKGD